MRKGIGNEGHLLNEALGVDKPMGGGGNLKNIESRIPYLCINFLRSAMVRIDDQS